MDDLLKGSIEIYRQAEIDFRPYAVVMMFSGGDDSLTALTVARKLGIKIDYLMHVNTRTGIHETTEFVHRTSGGMNYLEMDAGQKYERSVMRKGFFGKGQVAHTYAYHILKREQFVKGLSSIRQRKHNRNILLLSGARKQESDNRMITMKEPINADRSNIWVNLINEWTKMDCMDFLHENKVERNPVSALLHRSGECMCGTMQSLEARREAAYWYPHWGKWLDDLEARVFNTDHWWGWGKPVPPAVSMAKAGQLYLPEFQPMCIGCIAREEK